MDDKDGGLAGFAIQEIQGDVFVIGGRDYSSTDGNPTGTHGYDGYQSAIHKLSCSSEVCSWSTINQELKVARYSTEAIPVPDTFCT